MIVSERWSENKTLRISAALAFTTEFVLLTGLGWSNHWLAHPQKNKTLDDSNFVEAQIYEIPRQSVLTSSELAKAVSNPDVVISKKVNQGTAAKKTAKGENENQIQHDPSPPALPTHGPVALFTPTPVIPSYLQAAELNASVVIEFLVSALGAVTPRLLTSSGNEELDALAISTAKRWQFRPAERERQAIDAKVRLRIIFEVR